MKNFKIGYTTGVFDLFHIGHLNILKKAKEECDYLIVGVTTDDLTFSMKNKKPIIPFNERISIIESIKYVDKAVAKSNSNNFEAWNSLKFDVMFKGDDWKDTDKGASLEKSFESSGVHIHYFPYTENTSSSILREVIGKFLAF